MAGSGRIFRVLRVLRAFRSARTIALFMSGRRTESAFLAAVLGSLILLTASSIAILHFESGPGTNIKDAYDAMWWAIATMSTVGYGDVYPLTPEGRLIGAAVMAAGVAVFGILSGVAVSWFLSPLEQQKDARVEELKELIQSLQGQVAELKTGPS